MHCEADEIKADPKPSTPKRDAWYKRYPRDYREGTRRLSLAARGAYSDILDLIFIEGGPILDDDFQVACQLRVKLRQWRAAKKELIAAGKIFVTDGRLGNRRAEAELAERQAVRKVQSSSNPRRALGDRSSDPKKHENGRKPSDINGGDGEKRDALSREKPDSQIAEDRKTDTNTPTASQQYDAERGELAGLNGSADLMLRDIGRWMGPGSESNARQWLASQLRIYGSDVTRDAYAKLTTDTASGSIIARPLQTWAVIAKRMAGEAKATPRSGRGEESDEMRQLMRAAMAPLEASA